MRQISHAASCLTCPRRSRTEWRDLDDVAMALVDRHKRDYMLYAGEVLYHQGDDSDGIFCIKEGLVGERRVDADGNSVLVRLNHAGTTIGYQEFLTKVPYRNSAEALKPCHVCFLGRPLIRQLLEASPSVGERFLRRSMDDFQRLEDDYVDSKTMDVRGRLLHVLMVLYERCGDADEDAGHFVDIPISRQDLAALVGTTPETISRTISKLNQSGLVRFHGKRADIPNLDAIYSEIAIAN